MATLSKQSKKEVQAAVEHFMTANHASKQMKPEQAQALKLNVDNLKQIAQGITTEINEARKPQVDQSVSAQHQQTRRLGS